MAYDPHVEVSVPNVFEDVVIPLSELVEHLTQYARSVGCCEDDIQFASGLADEFCNQFKFGHTNVSFVIPHSPNYYVFPHNP